MTWRPTALNISFLTVVGWALFLAVLTGRVELAVVAVPAVVALVAGRRPGTPPAWRIHRELSSRRLELAAPRFGAAAPPDPDRDDWRDWEALLSNSESPPGESAESARTTRPVSST